MFITTLQRPKLHTEQEANVFRRKSLQSLQSIPERPRAAPSPSASLTAHDRTTRYWHGWHGWHGWQGLVAVPHGAVEDGLLLLLELDDLLLDGFGLETSGNLTYLDILDQVQGDM